MKTKDSLICLAAICAGMLRTGVAKAQASLPHDLAVTNLYTLDKLAQADAAPHVVQARILNRGQLAVSNAVVRLRVSGANTLTSTTTVSLAPGAAAFVAFPAYLPGALGRQRLSVRVPADDNPANDSLMAAQVISRDTTSYITPGVPNFVRPGQIVFGLVGALGGRFIVGNTPRLVSSVRAYVTDTVSVGQEVVAFVADRLTGRVLSRSASRILTRTDVNRVLTFRLLEDLVVQNRDYLAGISISGRTGAPVRREVYCYGRQFETPLRPQGLYDSWPLAYMQVGDTPPSVPTDASLFNSGPPTAPDTTGGKLMVEVITAVPPACARPANLEVGVRGGPFRVAFDSIGNASGYEVAYGPLGLDPDRAAATGGQVVAQRRGPFVLAAALPGITYAFYVRSRCAGAVSSSAWVGPVFALSPCTSAGIFQLPYRENFDAPVPGQPFPCGTQALDADNNRSSWRVDSLLRISLITYIYYNSPPNALLLDLRTAEYPAGGAADDWFFTPPLYLEAARRYRLSFNYRNAGYPADRLAVWLGDAPAPPRQTTLLYRNPQVNTYPYLPANGGTTPAVQAVTVPADGFYHLGFQAYSQKIRGRSGNGYQLLLDDIELADDGLLPARGSALAAALRLYPNPAADGRFTLELNTPAGAGGATVRVADALGRAVLAGPVPASGRLSLDLSQHPAGVYVVQVCTAAGCATRKLVVGL